jgi:hypothetical protein
MLNSINAVCVCSDAPRIERSWGLLVIVNDRNARQSINDGISLRPAQQII